MNQRAARSASLHRGIVAVLGTCLLAACGSNSDSDSNPTLEPKLSAIEQQVFHRSCAFSSCHGTDRPQEDLSLAGPTYEVLVNKPSSEVPTRMLVAPADPSGSYLLEKLSSDHPTVGSRMPYTSPPLPNYEITAVRQWIESGAQND